MHWIPFSLISLKHDKGSFQSSSAAMYLRMFFIGNQEQQKR